MKVNMVQTNVLYFNRKDCMINIVWVTNQNTNNWVKFTDGCDTSKIMKTARKKAKE